MLILLKYFKYFPFFHSLSNLMEDFLVLLELSAQCAEGSGSVARIKQEILSLWHKNDMILACTFLPLGRKSFLLSSYFTPQCVPQTRATVLQGRVV